MYPIPSEQHPLLAPVVARIRAAGVAVKSSREVIRVWGRGGRGRIGACNFAGPAVDAGYAGYPRADVAQCWVTLCLGEDVERSHTGLSSRDDNTTHRQLVVVVSAPAGWTVERLMETLARLGVE